MIFLWIKERKKKEISCCRRAVVMKWPLQNRGLLKCDVQDETWRKPRPEGPFFSSSPADLDALLLPSSYLGKKDTKKYARKLPKENGLNQSDGFFSRNPKSLNREREKKGGPLDLPSFSNRDPLLLPFWVLMGLSIPLLTSSWAAPKLLGISPLAPRVHVST